MTLKNIYPSPSPTTTRSLEPWGRGRANTRTERQDKQVVADRSYQCFKYAPYPMSRAAMATQRDRLSSAVASCVSNNAVVLVRWSVRHCTNQPPNRLTGISVSSSIHPRSRLVDVRIRTLLHLPFILFFFVLILILFFTVSEAFGSATPSIPTNRSTLGSQKRRDKNKKT